MCISSWTDAFSLIALWLIKVKECFNGRWQSIVKEISVEHCVAMGDTYIW